MARGEPFRGELFVAITFTTLLVWSVEAAAIDALPMGRFDPNGEFSIQFHVWLMS